MLEALFFFKLSPVFCTRVCCRLLRMDHVIRVAGEKVPFQIYSLHTDKEITHCLLFHIEVRWLRQHNDRGMNVEKRRHMVEIAPIFICFVNHRFIR